MPALRPLSLLPRVRVSLRAHLVAVVLAASLPLALIVAWQAWAHAREQRVQLDEQLERSATALAQAVQAELQASLDALATLAQSEPVLRGDTEGLRRQLATGLPRAEWHSVFLIDAQGTLQLDTAQGSGFTVAGALGDLHAQALRSGRGVVAGPIDTPDGASASVLLALPVQGGAQVLGARVDTAAWRRVAAAASRPENGYALVHDARHRLISTTLTSKLPPGAALPAETIAAMGGRPQGVQELRGLDGRPVHAAWQPVQAAGWGVQVGVPVRVFDAARDRALLAAWLAAALFVLLGVALALLTARQVARTLRAWAREGPDAAGGEPWLRELAQLRQVLRQNARRERELRRVLEDDIEQRRQAEADLRAAQQRAEAGARECREQLARLQHELRNPLGALQTAADVLAGADPASQTSAEARAIIVRQVQRLSERLHELAREQR